MASPSLLRVNVMTSGNHIVSAPRLLACQIPGSPLLRLLNAELTRVSYAPFGTTTDAGRLGFTGKIREPQGTLYLLGNGYRAYLPNIMKFAAADELSPFGKGGLNAYTYCRNQPVTQHDPAGRFPIMAVLAGLLGIAGVATTVAGVSMRANEDSPLAMGLIIIGSIAAGVGTAGLFRSGLKVARQRSNERSLVMTIKRRGNPETLTMSRDRRSWLDPSQPNRHTDELNEFLTNQVNARGSRRNLERDWKGGMADRFDRAYGR